MSEFRLPDVGEGLTEAEVLTWHVAVGDVVEVNQTIVDIETAKSVVELPSPFAGEVTALLVPEGTTVPVGTPIIAIGRSSPTTRRRRSRPTSRRTTRGRRTRRPGRSASRCWSATACAPPRRAAVGARATRPCRPLHRPVG